MNNPINNYCRTICFWAHLIGNSLANCFGWLGQRAVTWIRDCFGCNQRINAIRDDILPTIPPRPTIEALTPRDIQPKREDSRSIALQTPAPAIDTPPVAFNRVILNFESVEKRYSIEPDFNPVLFKKVTEFLNFLVNSSPYTEKPDDDDEVEVDNNYIPFRDALEEHLQDPLSGGYVGECIRGFPQEIINRIAENVSDHFLYDYDLNNILFMQFILYICHFANHESAGMFFAACMTGNVNLIQRCLLNKDVEITLESQEGLCALNYASPETLQQLEKEGSITKEIRELYWNCFFGYMDLNYKTVFNSIPKLFPKELCQAPQTYPNEEPNFYYSETMVTPNYSANYVLNRRGIAAAGPQASTVANFYRMILESNVDLIVQLDRAKCCNYFPTKKGDVFTFEDINVKLDDEISTVTINGISIIRRLLSINGKQVPHLEVVGWPDGDVIPIEALTNLVLHMHHLKPKMFLAHCWKGMGRAGTLIASYGIFDHYNKSTRPLIPVKLVLNLRSERAFAVQTRHQFKLIHNFNKSCFPKPYPCLGNATEEIYK